MRMSIELARMGLDIVVVRKGVELIVLLVALSPPGAQIQFLKPGKCKKKLFSKQQSGDNNWKGWILFVYAVILCVIISLGFLKRMAS